MVNEADVRLHDDSHQSATHQGKGDVTGSAWERCSQDPDGDRFHPTAIVAPKHRGGRHGTEEQVEEMEGMEQILRSFWQEIFPIAEVGEKPDQAQQAHPCQGSETCVRQMLAKLIQDVHPTGPYGRAEHWPDPQPLEVDWLDLLSAEACLV